MMQRGIVVFISVNLIIAWVAFGALYALKDKMGQMAGLLVLPLAIVPFIMVYVAQSITKAPGNPFRGLVWGNTSWYFLTWIFGVLAGGLVVLLVLGLRMAGWDSQMGDYVQMIVDQTAQRGQTMPQSAMGTLKIGGYATAFAGPILGPWFGAALGCLGTFAWYGWLGRRLLVYGRPAAMITLAVIYLLSSFGAGLVDNPAYASLSLPMRMGLVALVSVTSLPATLWVFLKTRSAVLPALAMASFQGGYSFAIPFFSGANPLYAPPVGLMISAVALLVGLALWSFKDPGGMDLAVAAVAYDGTPLTPEQYKSLEAHEHSAVNTPPPPPTPPVAG